MPQGNLGKRVARAARSGGNRSYRGKRPVGWYASLVLIVLAGSALIGYSRYEKVNAASTTTTGPTTTTFPAAWHVALAFDLCGSETLLASSTNAPPLPITAASDGIVTGVPQAIASSKDFKGAKATLANFLRYNLPKATVTGSEIQLPGMPPYKNGDSCQGKTGEVQVAVWANVTAPSPVVRSGSSALDVVFTDQQMMTVAFLPKGATVPPPPPSVRKALLDIINPPPPPPTTTVKATTTTTKPGSTTTTSPGSTTTSAGTSTTTTGPAGTTTTTAKPTTTT